MIFLDELNHKTGGKFHYLRVKSCIIQRAKALVEIEMLVPDHCYSIFGDQDKKEIDEVVRTIIPDNLSCVIKYTKSCIDKDVVRKFLFDYMDKNSPLIAFNSLDIDTIIEEKKVVIEIRVKAVFYDYLSSDDFTAKVTDYFAHCICQPVEVRIIKVAGKVDYGELIQQDDEMDVYVMRRVRTSAHVKIRGKSIIGSPKYIGDKNQPDDNAIFCGKIVDYQRRIAKSGNPFYIMKIDDMTGVLIVKGFTKAPGVSVYDELKIGDEVIVMGKLSPDSYAKDLTLMINSISRCVIDYDSLVTKKPFKKVAKSYKLVKPEKYVDVVQLNFLQEKNLPTPPERLLGQTFVVFDLETTGLYSNTDKVIEIGAVKVVDGVITETFSALCDPRQPLEDKIIEITGITDNMLIGLPIFEEIFPDFYKFSRDSVLVAHNANFDMGFINRYAKELNYNMDNAVLDTVKLAQQCIISHNYKLQTLCKAVNIDLTNAHRAVHDATATAKLFMEIARRRAFDV